MPDETWPKRIWLVEEGESQKSYVRHTVHPAEAESFEEHAEYVRADQALAELRTRLNELTKYGDLRDPLIVLASALAELDHLAAREEER